MGGEGVEAAAAGGGGGSWDVGGGGGGGGSWAGVCAPACAATLRRNRNAATEIHRVYSILLDLETLSIVSSPLMLAGSVI